MPPVVIDGGLQIRIVWLLPGEQTALNVLHSNIGSSPAVNAAMAGTISQAVADAHTSSGLNAVQPASVQIDRVDIRDVRTANQPIITGTAGMPSPGTVADGDMLPKQDALVVTHRTALAGRSFRGRTYLPGFDETESMAAGEAATSARDAAAAFLQDLQAGVSAEGWPLAVASLVSDGVRRDPGVLNNITSFSQRVSSWGSQRRRRTAY